jgi:phosphatidylinositol alpha-1,6-mannosyltransferase
MSGAPTLLNVYGLELWSDLSAWRRLAMTGHSHVVADCHATAAYVQANAMHPNPPSVIWDCVDLKRFNLGIPDLALMDRYRLPDPAQHPIVMSLGRLTACARHKGFDRLIRGFAQLLPELPGARLVIAGQGADIGYLEQIAKTEGISREVVFTGGVDEADLPGFYRFAHVFSLVSDFGHARGEGIPLTPLEALACGVPVVVGNEDGSREAVDRERNGLVVSPRDPGELVAALRRLLDEDRGQRQCEARAVAEERFGYASFEDKHRTLYQQLLGS